MKSRRFWLSVLGIIALGIIGVSAAEAVAWPIAAICMGVASANAWEARSKGVSNEPSV